MVHLRAFSKNFFSTCSVWRRKVSPLKNAFYRGATISFWKGISIFQRNARATPTVWLIIEFKELLTSYTNAALCSRGVFPPKNVCCCCKSLLQRTVCARVLLLLYSRVAAAAATSKSYPAKREEKEKVREKATKGKIVNNPVGGSSRARALGHRCCVRVYYTHGCHHHISCVSGPYE